ncbi:MAG: hypothetical protein ACI85K_003279, partial [Hyphomicrobiaceae bacterium]
NGWVTSGGYTGGSNWTPVVGTFLSNEMWCAAWRDLNPSAGGDVYVDSTAARTVVSWDGVPNYSNTGSNTLQIQFWANGDVHFVYQNMTVAGSYLTGYSLAGAADPGSIDISASLNGTVTACSSTSGTPDVALDASARPVLGSTINLVTTNVPPTAVAGLSILSLTPIVGGLELTFFGMPGCYVYQDLDVISSMVVAGGTGSASLSIPSTAALIGTEVLNQSVVLVLNINAANMVTSNGLELSLGDI